ncbi:hypothetical protein [Deinococcus ruber]|uniref:Uncharacterized protein n=1 Tax=Deinococcus ruber TaxID=1848197 RepID=A0A918CC56_9DEIO|nr:hypothetical protein [Deinococcus ruber]GGR15683.1 hypothetical protein GCM10008957_30530 [Deinococcus ruber]
MIEVDQEERRDAARAAVRRLSQEVVEAYPTVEALPVLRSLVRSHLSADLQSVLPEDEQDALLTHSLRNALTVRWLRTTE